MIDEDNGGIVENNGKASASNRQRHRSRRKPSDKPDEASVPKLSQGQLTDEEMRIIHNRRRELANAHKQQEGVPVSNSKPIDTAPKAKKSGKKANGGNPPSSGVPSVVFEARIPEVTPALGLAPRGGLLRIPTTNQASVDNRSARKGSSRNCQKSEAQRDTTAEPSSIPRAPREGVDFPRKKLANAAMLMQLRLESQSAYTSKPVSKESDNRSGTVAPSSTEQAMAKLEPVVQSAFEIISASSELCKSFSLMGMALGLPAEIFGPISQLEKLYLSVLEDSTSARAAVASKVPVKLWVVKKKQLEIFQRVLNPNSSAYFAESTQREQVTRAYILELSACLQLVTWICGVLENLLWPQGIVCAPEIGKLSEIDNDEVCLREGLQVLYVAWGDILRYQDTLSKGKKSRSKESKFTVETPLYHEKYLLARNIAPWVGASHKYLCIFHKQCGNISEIVLQLLCSMSVSQPLSGSRDSLVEVLEQIRTKTDAMHSSSGWSGLSIHDHQSRFEMHFLCCMEISLTRIHADQFETHMEKAKRHLGMLIQMLYLEAETTLQQNSQIRESARYFDYSKSVSKAATSFHSLFQPLFRTAEGENSTSDMPTPKISPMIQLLFDVESTIFRCVLIALLVIHQISVKFNLNEALNGRTQSDVVEGSSETRPATTTSAVWSSRDVSEADVIVERLTATNEQFASDGLDVDLELLAKRLCTIRLQQVQRIPGFADATKLIISLVTLLLSNQTQLSGNYSSTIASSTTSSFLSPIAEAVNVFVSLKPVTLFFRWLSTNPCYHILNVMNKIEWNSLESHASDYSSRLTQLKLESASESILPEDKVLLGLIPFCGKVNCYERCNTQTIVDPPSTIVMDQNLSTKFETLLRQLFNYLKILVFTPIQIAEDLPCPVTFDESRLAVYNSSSNKLRVLGSSIKFEFRTSSFGAVVRAPSKATKAFSNSDTSNMLSSSTQEVDGELVLLPANSRPTIALDSEPNIDRESEENDSDICDVDDSISDLSNECIEPDTQEQRRGILAVGNISLNDRSTTGQKGRRRNERNARKSTTASKDPLAFIRRPATLAPPLMVVDAANVAMRHGLNAKFSCRGIQIVMKYFQLAGHRVISFLPDYYLNFEDVARKRAEARLQIKESIASKIPDDVSLLQELVKQGLIVGTPSSDYDDDYCLVYAKSHDGYIVTNDLFRDHIQKISNPHLRNETRDWLKTHCMSYTFVGDEFLPNPGFGF